jgi:hypothetical protein
MSRILHCLDNGLTDGGEVVNFTHRQRFTSTNISDAHFSERIYFLAGVEQSPLLLQSFIGLLYQPWMIDADDCGVISGTNN